MTTEEEWQSFVKQMIINGEHFAAAVEQLSTSTLTMPFTNEKYGDYYKNISGVIEHIYYHFGQIVLLTKMT